MKRILLAATVAATVLSVNVAADQVSTKHANGVTTTMDSRMFTDESIVKQRVSGKWSTDSTSKEVEAFPVAIPTARPLFKPVAEPGASCYVFTGDGFELTGISNCN